MLDIKNIKITSEMLAQIAELDINIETTKKSLQALTAYGYLAKQGATKGAWYERAKGV